MNGYSRGQRVGVARGHPGGIMEQSEPRAGVDRGVTLANSAVDGLQRLARHTAALIVAASLAVSWLAVYVAGGAGVVPPHFFYVALILAAARFGYPGVIATALSAGVIAGPLLPSDVAAGTSQAASDWLARTGSFVGIGLVMAAVVRGLRTSLERQAALARAERGLAEHKVAVLETVSHEFRTPITIINGALQTLHRVDLDPVQRGEFLDMAEASVTRLSNLVDAAVVATEATAGPPGELRSIDLVEMCHEIARDLASIGGRDRVGVQPRHRQTPWRGDARAARIIVRCLIENALKYSPANEAVEVVIARAEALLEVRVCDRGPGLADRDGLRTHALVRGDVDATRGQAGLGLGLATARALIERVGGELDLVDRDGGGTEAVARFPE